MQTQGSIFVFSNPNRDSLWVFIICVEGYNKDLVSRLDNWIFNFSINRQPFVNKNEKFIFYFSLI